jgi:hypothetical protein
MGVGTYAILPEHVRLTDVADVVAIRAGLPFERQAFESGEGTTVWVHGVNVRGHAEVPAMATIELRGPMVDGEHAHTCTFHFENDYGAGGRLLVSQAATPFWQAVLRGVVDVFGGTVDYEDTDNIQVDYGSPGLYNVLWNANDGDAWEAKMDAVAAVKPLTKDDLARVTTPV